MIFMDNNTPELILYYNQNYLDKNTKAYMIYCDDGGRYLCSEKSSFKIVDKRNSGTDTLPNPDNYATSRGFSKILELKRSKNGEKYSIQWNTINIPYNMKNILKKSSNEIVKLCRRGISIQYDPYVMHFYSLTNILINLLP